MPQPRMNLQKNNPRCTLSSSYQLLCCEQAVFRFGVNTHTQRLRFLKENVTHLDSGQNDTVGAVKTPLALAVSSRTGVC